MTTRLPPSGWRRAAGAVVVVVLLLIACHWRPDPGFTGLIRFGEAFADTRLPEVRALPVAIAPQTGYDGQFYAQIAVSPDLDRPELAAALPDLSYRARRILLPAVAHVLGLGRPWWVLQVYALLNVGAWLALAWIWARECPPATAEGLARWSVALLSLGALDSVRLALTDLPATLLIVLAVRALRGARSGIAAAWLALGGLVRETTVLAALALRPSAAAQARHTGNPVPTNGANALIRRWLWRAAVALPLLGWSVWLRVQFPDAPSNLAGNFDWPGAAWARHLARCATAVAQGDFDSRYTFGLLGAGGLAAQSVYILSRWRDPDPWLRMALPFALLFWILGDYVWHGYWAAARVCLPLTLAFVRVAPLNTGFALANLTLLHGLYRLVP